MLNLSNQHRGSSPEALTPPVKILGVTGITDATYRATP